MAFLPALRSILACSGVADNTWVMDGGGGRENCRGARGRPDDALPACVPHTAASVLSTRFNVVNIP